MTENLKYKIPENIFFKISSEGIKLYDLKAKTTNFIAYPEALVWDMLAREVDLKQIRKAFTLLTKLDEMQVEKNVKLIIDNWLKISYLTVVSNG